MNRRLLLPTLLAPLSGLALDWRPLPLVPDERGFAGSFAGVHEGALIVAGGTNFPDRPPWEGGTKIWYDDVFVLDSPSGRWRKAGTLPRPNGYGVSITTDDGVLIIGGGNADEHFREVHRLVLKNGAPQFTALPPLPKPCAFMTGALVKNTVFIAGGLERPADTQALDSLWSLDLSNLAAGWRIHPPIPGGGRILAAAGAWQDELVLCSGAALKAGPDGKPARDWLKDAFRFETAGGWRRLADLPRVAVAAPSPMPLVGGRLLLIGGDDGALVNFEPKSKHPGFPRDILAFDPAAETWEKAGEAPFSLVTTPAVPWRGGIVIPGGEARPGVRSPAVWTTPLKN